MTAPGSPPPFVVAVLGQKGGVGKTTLATNLAALAHLEGRRTLLLDCDLQGSAFDWYHAREEHSRLSGLVVARADRALTPRKFGELTDGFAVVIVDGPPRGPDITRAVAVAADVVVLPARPGPFDAWASVETLALLNAADELREELHRKPVRRVIVINGAPSRGRNLAFALDALCGEAALAPVVIGHRVLFALASAAGESVLTTDAKSPAAAEVRSLWAALSAAPVLDEVRHVH